MISKKPITTITAKLNAELVERVRRAVYHNPDVTFRDLLERGLRRSVGDLERRRNNGTPFPKRKGALKKSYPKQRRRE